MASVIVPRPDRFYWPSLQVLAFVHRNPSIEIFRQAISIDERRRLFRLQRWEEGGQFWPSRFAPKDKWKDQDSLQVWFAGVHADIGGGYPEVQSGLSKYPLLWMIEEAVKCGLKVDRRTLNQLGWGRQRKNSPFSYVKPGFLTDPENPESAAWQPHNSMNAAWRVLEYLPKADEYKEWPARPSFLGRYIPNAEPRVIPEDALIHESAIEKIAKDPNYKPGNIPKKYRTIPMLTAPVEPPADADDEDDA